MTDKPNLSREGIQKLNFVGQRGNQLVYQGPSRSKSYCLTCLNIMPVTWILNYVDKRVIMLDVETVTCLGMNDVRSRKNKSVTKPSEEGINVIVKHCNI